MKLERIVQQQSQKISKLELDASERSVKLKTKLKYFEEKCKLNCCKFDGSVSNYSNSMDSKSISPVESKEASMKGHPDQMTKKRLPNREIRRDLFPRRTASAHVSFSAYLSYFQEHLGVHQVVKFNRVITNDGNAYNSHTGVFTVPVTGTYMFIFYVCSSNTNVQFDLVVDDSIKASGVAKPSPLGQSKDVQGGGAVILKLNQGESVWIENIAADSAVYSRGDDRWVTFSGFVVY
ncbi:C1q-related factor-like [Mercenaria mercenaria]|uniref:C1q-related factor-like n=1 Tax=Mercenaria mercenaria TaxID=6596 RepID=UPI00234F7CF4|nr:C1q-related factor-like [Mercenaria mercenaria]